MSATVHSHPRAERVTGPLWTPGFRIVALLAAIGVATILFRFVFGLGRATALTDAFPWGIWIAFDVVSGTALACGGYSVAILVYLLNKGAYHPLVRPAVLTSALGYTLAGSMIAVDVGRPWWIYRIPLHFWQWNLNSALLEVALCVMAYVGVLWIEMSPPILERWQSSPNPTLRGISTSWLPRIEKLMPLVLAAGLLLPTMHQSSLGTVMLLAGRKVDPIWSTPLLPLLFLVSCIGMGYGVVVFEGAVAAKAFGRKPETALLGRLAGAMVPVIGFWLLLRFGDLAWRGQLGHAFSSGGKTIAFLAEIALFVVPMVMLFDRAGRRRIGHLFRAGMLVMAGGVLYRFNTYLIGFDPGANWHYFPSVPEILVTVGFVALEVVGYVLIVRSFPILAGAPAEQKA